METNQSRLRTRQMEMLDDVIRWLAVDRHRRVKITGNADDRAPYDYNMKLSTKRAMAARDYLFRRGVPPEQVVMATHSEAIPLKSEKGRESRALNRSIVISEVRN